MSARAIMVLGCTSGAGKSWLVTALCRYYSRKGHRVAPFKAQNMSNHARVATAAEGAGEIGSAQYFQALAAGVEPDVRMNPVLLKPETDTRSQVVVLGRVREELATCDWRARADELWTTARTAYLSLSAEHDLIIIEGAGSPAEINLARSDFVNTRTALLSQAAALLVVDIDRGGAFAHLYGTHQLMDAGVRALLRGFVLNRFRGDAGLLAPGPENLEALTGVRTVAVLPWVRNHGVPEEDAVPRDSAGTGDHFVVVTAPHASNLDEFEPLRGTGVQLTFTREAEVIARADWLILPGSKHTRADLAWLRREGLDAAILTHLRAGRPLLALCGGLQLLGERLEDPDELDGPGPGHDAGLGAFPLVTRYLQEKRLARGRARFAVLDGPWSCLSQLEVSGYEIHLGQTRPTSGATPQLKMALAGTGSDSPLGWQHGAALGVYFHGLFENPAVLAALTHGHGHSHDAAFERVADVVEQHFAPGFLDCLARID